MIIKMLVLLMMLAAVCLPGLASADEASLTVIGTASVTVQPDMARISVGVSNKAATVEEATDANAKLMAAVVEAIQAAGVADTDLSTENYYVSMEQSYSPFGDPNLEGYSVSNTLHVRIRDTKLIGAVIDAAVAAGANQVYGVTFLSSQEKDAHDEALTLAIQEGMRKASLMAMAAGKQLGALESIEEGGSRAYAVNTSFDAQVLASGTSIMAENLTVTATVTMTYELK